MIYHITTRQALESAQPEGWYSPPSLASEGFIHCSQRRQILRVANAFYRDVPDLLILCIDEEAVESEVVFEDPIHPQGQPHVDATSGELFPHIYGPLNLTAVVATVPLLATTEGFSLPADLP